MKPKTSTTKGCSQWACQNESWTLRGPCSTHNVPWNINPPKTSTHVQRPTRTIVFKSFPLPTRKTHHSPSPWHPSRRLCAGAVALIGKERSPRSSKSSMWWPSGGHPSSGSWRGARPRSPHDPPEGKPTAGQGGGAFFSNGPRKMLA